MEHRFQSHAVEATIRALRANDEPTPFQTFERELNKVRSRNQNFCDCRKCSQCVGRKQAMLDNIADELLVELESE